MVKKDLSEIPDGFDCELVHIIGLRKIDDEIRSLRERFSGRHEVVLLAEAPQSEFENDKSFRYLLDYDLSDD